MTFLSLQVATVLATALAGATIATLGRRLKTNAWTVLAGGAAAGAVALVMAMAAAQMGIGGYGLIRLFYLTCVIGLPLAAASVLALGLARRTTLTRAGGALAGATLMAAPLGVYISWIEPNRLTLEHAELQVAAKRDGREPITLGVLADLQSDTIGPHERAAVDMLMAQHPDIVLIPGDLFQGTWWQWRDSRDALRELLARLEAPGGVYFVQGDIDDDNTYQVLAKTKIRVLNNDVAHVRVRDRDVTIGGVDPTNERALLEIESEPGAGDIRVLLTHRPDPVLRLPENTRVDLTVAGHTHGGQVVIPGYGPLITRTSVPRDVAAGGLHRMGGRAIYVSRGVGMERWEAPPMRFNCVPEVSIIRIYSSSGA